MKNRMQTCLLLTALCTTWSSGSAFAQCGSGNWPDCICYGDCETSHSIWIDGDESAGGGGGIWTGSGSPSFEGTPHNIYGLNHRGATLFQSTTDDFMGAFSEIGPADYLSFAMDMDLSATTLYAVRSMGENVPDYGTIDVTTGAFTSLGQITGPPPGIVVAGLSIDPVSGNWYLLTAGDPVLYVGDITTGVFDEVGFTGYWFNIDLAIDSQGNAYTHDLWTDQLLSIDLWSGEGTPIGLTGIDAEYAQGMDFDYSTDTLYAAAYSGSGVGQFGTFDLNTGAFNALQETTPLNAEMEIVIDTPLVDCVGDLNSDGIIGPPDLVELLGAWGLCAGECSADLNVDAVVDAADLLLMLGAWGTCP